ncbi:uncharacterized protein KIAA1671 homolog isoform X1 [Tachyglossus aculeatus]|uniref:uncharacterized protein KIAA1671 homolog isoform X1 n=1 Tax=Tachyglossus aculeatus TaxID=9261 RepID=UPI0018F627CD|nr:uncharacterized protein KIAA1671 homolog isoform X1 [Tachyglossus aculeatus]
MSTGSSRPRLSPRPFSKDAPSESFANVKFPVTSLKGSHGTWGSLWPSPAVESSREDKAQDDNMPSLVEQNTAKDERLSQNATFSAKALYPQPGPNMVIVFAAASIEKPGERATLTTGELRQDGATSFREAPPSLEPGGTTELGLPFRKPPGALCRRTSLSFDPKQVSQRSPGMGVEQDPRENHAILNPQDCRRRDTDKADSTPEVQLRPKRRPVSAIFLESIQDRKENSLAALGENSPPATPEKTCVRKPRPLSVDLTAKFENKNVPPKISSPWGESREKGPSAHPADADQRRERPVLERKAEESRSVTRDPVPSDCRGGADEPDFLDVQNRIREWKQIVPLKHTDSLSSRTSAEISAKIHRPPRENPTKLENGQNEKETGTLVLSLKADRSGDDGNETPKEEGRPREKSSERTHLANTSPATEWVKGSVKKRISWFGSENIFSPSGIEPPPPSTVEKDNRTGQKDNIQDRSKGWKKEGQDIPGEGLWQPFPPRPLSADLTKVFSSPAPRSEGRWERSAEPNSPKELQGKHKEGHLWPEADLDEVSASGSQRKSVRRSDKAGQIERQGSCVRGGIGSSLQTQTALGTERNAEVKPRPSPSEEEENCRTIRATVFEHHVQRCYVGDRPGPTDPEAKLSGRLSEEASVATGFSRERACEPGDKMGGGTDGPRGFRVRVSVPPAALLNEEQKLFPADDRSSDRWKKPTLLPSENRPVGQEWGPRRDIVPGNGTFSEVPKDEAATGRSQEHRSSLWERYLSDSPQDKPDGQAGCFRAPVQASPVRDGPEASGPGIGEAKVESGGDPVPHGRGPEPSHARVQDVGSTAREKGTTWHVRSLRRKNESPTCVPENFVVQAVRALACDTSLAMGQEKVSTQGKKAGSRSSAERGDQLHPFSTDLHPRTDLGANGEGDSLSLEINPPRNAAPHAGEQSRFREAEERLGKPRESEGKTVERWRRRTLPVHLGLDEFGLSERLRRLERRGELLQTDNEEVRRRSQHLQGDGDSKEATLVVSQEPSDRPSKTVPSISRVPDDRREKSTSISVGESRQPFSRGKDPPVNSNPTDNSGGNLSAPSRHPSTDLPSATRGSSPGAFDSKNLGRDNLNLLKDNKPPEQSLLREDEKRQSGSRSPRTSGLDGRMIDVDSLLFRGRPENSSSPRDDPKGSGCRGSSHHISASTPRFKSPCKESDTITGKKQDGDSEDALGKEREDGFKHRILDIDALMAEYKDGCRSGQAGQEERDPLTLDRGGSQQERPDHGRVAEKTPLKSGWTDQKESRDPSYPRRSYGLSPPRRRLGSLTIAHPQPESTKCPTESPGRDAGRQYSQDPRGRFPSSLSGRLADAVDRGDGLPMTGAVEKETPGLGRQQGLEGRGSQPEPSWDPWTAVASEEVPRRRTVRKKDGESSTRGRNKARWSDRGIDPEALPLEIKHTYSEKGPPWKIREELSLKREARGRRDAQHCQPSPPKESSENQLARRGPSYRDLEPGEEKKAPQDLERQRRRPRTDRPLGRDPTPPPMPRRSRSFCKDKRMEPFLDQLRDCLTRASPEAKDTDTLVQEADSQYGTWNEQGLSRDSFTVESPSSDSTVSSTRQQQPGIRPPSLSSQTEPTSGTAQIGGDSSRDQRSISLDRSSTDLDSTDGTEASLSALPDPDGKSDDFSFIDRTSVLDSSALKTRVQLSKRRRRRAPTSHSSRGARTPEAVDGTPLPEEMGSSWMFRDSTEEKSPAPREDGDEETSPRSERAPGAPTPRRPVFPGMDPSVLKAQLRKRQEEDVPAEATSSKKWSKSPKSPFHSGNLGSRVLAPSGVKEDSSQDSSPQWLKELKSKKRQSQYENQA